MNQFRNIDRPSAAQEVTIQFMRCQAPDSSPDISHLEQDYADVTDLQEREKYLAQDRERLAAYHREEWNMRGLWVEARVMVPIGQGSFTMHTIKSAGAWGVESDCGDEHEKELWDEEEQELRRQLAVMGAAFIPPQTLTDRALAFIRAIDDALLPELRAARKSVAEFAEDMANKASQRGIARFVLMSLRGE
jgi:nitrogen fixation/metabolism regulation signal transduction histidine kinase